jgi:hypothetical protein
MPWQPLLHDIRALKLDLARLDPRAGMPVAPPSGADPRALEAVERRLGRSLPPSYRALLVEHDGVPQLYQGASLLGVRPLLRGTYVDLARMVIDAPGGTPDADLVPFGIDPRGEVIFAWDRSRSGDDGELEVVLWMNEIGARVPSFPAFLEMVRDMIASEIEERLAAGFAPRSSRRVPVRSDRPLAAPLRVAAA